MSKQDKLIYIPGWLDRAEYHGFHGPDIWGGEFINNKAFVEEVVVAHSLGASYFAQNINLFPNAKKIILINPLVLRKGVFFWASNWVMFMLKEGFFMFNSNRIKMIKFIFPGIKNGKRLLKRNAPEMLNKIPNENLVVLRGEKDKYFFCRKSRKLLESKGFKIVEVKKAGHIVNEEIEKTIREMV